MKCIVHTQRVEALGAPGLPHAPDHAHRSGAIQRWTTLPTRCAAAIARAVQASSYAGLGSGYQLSRTARTSVVPLLEPNDKPPTQRRAFITQKSPVAMERIEPPTRGFSERMHSCQRVSSPSTTRQCMAPGTPSVDVSMSLSELDWCVSALRGGVDAVRWPPPPPPRSSGPRRVSEADDPNVE